MAVQIAAFGAAFSGALALRLSERFWPDVQEGTIGVAFVLAASLGILLLADNPHGGEHLQDLLVGQILWVGTAQLAPAAALSAVALALWFGFGERLGRLGFYLLFASIVTVSVQLVGVYLVFASLIVPALASRLATGSSSLWLGYGVGAAGYGLGLMASAHWDLPAGAMIVCAMALVGVLVYALTPRSTGHRASSHPVD
jgi:zinc/manganese transport system permease protein